MRKFTKSLLTLALLVFAVGGANAEKKYADLSKLATVGGTNATWDGSTNTITWIGQSNNMVSNFDFPAGDYSTWEKVVVKVTSIDNCIGVRIQIRANGKEKTKPFNGTGTIEVDLSSYGFDAGDLNSVEWIRMLGSGYSDGESHTINSDTPGSAVISEVYLERPDINYIEDKTIQVAPVGTTDLNGIIGTGDAWSIIYPITIADATLFGSFTIDGDAQSANIAAYDYLLFNVTEASADANTYLRVFVSTEQSDGNATRVCLYPHPIADYASVGDWTAETTITAPGVYVVKISDYPLLRGVKNKAYWQGAAGSIKISLAYVGSGSPVAPVDDVVRVGEEALTDPSATCFDVTKLDGTGLTFNATNPNALFIAKSGQLTNTKNVIVSGVCANLELTDGYAFQAPSAFTATAAKYTKSVSDAGFATLVMPFAAALPTGVKAYNLTGVSGSSIANTAADAIATDKPVLIEAAEGSYDFTATDAAIAATASEVFTNGLLNGTYAASSVVGDGSTIYVLANKAAVVGFYKLADGQKVPTGKAYLKVTTPAPEFLIFDGNTTGIESVKTVENKGEFFNLAGQRVAQPTKGLYIVNGKKVVLK